MTDFKRVSPGEAVTLSAAEWNAIVDAALAEKGRRHSTTFETSPQPREQTIVRLKNATGANLPRHAIVDIQGGPIFAPSQSLDEFLGEVTFRGTVPTAQTKHSFAVLLDPIPSGGIGRATVGGTTWCKVNMVDASHVSAEAVAGETTRLQSVKWSGNPQNLLWAEAGTGTKWALLRMDAGSCGCGVTEPPPTGCCPLPNCSTYSTADVEVVTPMGDTVPFYYVGLSNIGGVMRPLWRACKTYSIGGTVHRLPTGACDIITTGDVPLGMVLYCDLTAPGSFRFGVGTYLYRCGVEAGSPFYPVRGPNVICDPGHYIRAIDTNISASWEGINSGGITLVAQTGTHLTFNVPVLPHTGVFPVFPGNYTVNKPTVPTGYMPDILYLSDGFGTVPLVYNGPETTPTTSANSWWGCAMRPGSLVRNFNNPPSSDCTTPGTNADVAVHFQLFCDTFTPTGYRLSLHLPSCTDTQTGRRYLANHPTYNCSAPSSPTVYGITSAGTNAPPVLPEDCANFAISIPAVFLAPGPTQDAQLPYYIYGTSETFLISK